MNSKREINPIYTEKDTIPSILEGTWVIDSFIFVTTNERTPGYYASISNSLQLEKVYVSFNKYKVFLHSKLEFTQACAYEGLFHLSNRTKLDFIYIPHGIRTDKYSIMKKKFPTEFVYANLQLFNKNGNADNCLPSNCAAFRSLFTECDSMSVQGKHSVFYSYIPTHIDLTYQIYMQKVK